MGRSKTTMSCLFMKLIQYSALEQTLIFWWASFITRRHVWPRNSSAYCRRPHLWQGMYKSVVAALDAEFMATMWFGWALVLLGIAVFNGRLGDRFGQRFWSVREDDSWRIMSNQTVQFGERCRKLYCNLAGLVSKVYLFAVVDGAVG